MAIDKQRVEEFEKKYRDSLLDKISEVGSKQYETISLMTTNARNMEQSNIDIPNTSTTLNNKLVELSQTFKKAGISMFSSELEDCDVVISSFLGNAIIQDLIDQLSKSSEKLGEYSQTIKSISKKKNEQIQALQNVSPIRKFFSRIRSFFVPVKPVDISLTEEEQSTLDSTLQEYRDIDNKIWNYNLEDNLVHALVKEIAGSKKFGEFDITHRYHAYTVPSLLEESVIPDLKKLRLEHLIPQLQEALIEEYKKDLPDPEIYQVSEEDMYLYVPDFSRESQRNKEFTGTNLEELHIKTREVLSDNEKKSKSVNRKIGKNGIVVDDLALIDKTVNASDRQVAINAIQDEIQAVHENNQDKKQEITDISLE